MDEKNSRPSFRPAQVVTEAEALRAFSSGSAEEIRLALIDGSRCLPDEWILPHAIVFLRHQHPDVRWAAAFALDQTRRRVEELLIQGAFDETEDDEHPIKLLIRVTSSDSEKGVRDMAATALGDMMSDFADAVRRSRSGATQALVSSPYMNPSRHFLDFIAVLEEKKIRHRLSSVRDEAVMVEIATPGDRWEVEFFVDGHIEVEQFRSTSDVLESSIDDLMKRIVVEN